MARQNGLAPQAVAGFVPNLINGISQQPSNIRFPSQADECVNHMPTLQEQLARRNPLETLFKLDNLSGSILAGTPLAGMLATLTQTTLPYTHWYRRDENEGYVVVFTGTTIKVYSFIDGTEKTVNFANGADNYHLSDTPAASFYCYTYKDTTFVVNRGITAEMAEEADGTPIGMLLTITQQGGNTSPSRNPEGLIVVKDCADPYEFNGKVYIEGSSGTFSVSPGAADTISTVAGSIVTDLTAFISGAGATMTRHENVVHITHPTKSVRIEVRDNRSGTAINSFTNTITRTTDLPPYAPDGYQVKVTGSTSNNNNQDQNTADDVYYTFEVSGSSTFAQGVWRETVAPGIQYVPNSYTLPHRLVREADGTFTFAQIQWENRNVGDEFTNPDPLFIGEKVHSVFLASNRFGILGGGAFNLSKADEANYYDFFKTTSLTALDTDPVFGIIPSSQVNKVYWAIQWNGELVIFGDSVDGAVSWSTTLAPNKISIDTPTRFGSSPLVPPTPSGGSLFFPKNRGDYSLLYEYKLDPVTALKDADNLTNYAGSYIPKDIIQMVGLEKDFLVMLADGERQKLYPYNYSRQNAKLVQQAFHRWEFNGDMLIIGIFIDSNKLYMLYRFDEEYFIGRIIISVGARDEGLPGKCYLDCRIDETVTGFLASYNTGTNRTTFTTPWNYGEQTKVVELRSSFTNTSGATYPAGYVIPIESQGTGTIVCVGNWEGAEVFIGVPFTSYYDPCKFHVYTQNPVDGGTVVDVWKKLTVKRLSLSYTNTGYFLIQAIDRVSGTVVLEEEMRTNSLDNIETVYDDYTLYGGVHLTAIWKPLDKYKIRILNNTTRPSFLTTIGWYGEYWDGAA